jgi:hypothetical protein
MRSIRGNHQGTSFSLFQLVILVNLLLVQCSKQSYRAPFIGTLADSDRIALSLAPFADLITMNAHSLAVQEVDLWLNLSKQLYRCYLVHFVPHITLKRSQENFTLNCMIAASNGTLEQTSLQVFIESLTFLYKKDLISPKNDAFDGNFKFEASQAQEAEWMQKKFDWLEKSFLDIFGRSIYKAQEESSAPI